MNQVEIVKSKIKEFYGSHSVIHVNVRNPRKTELINQPAVITAVYANLFEIEDLGSKSHKTYTHQYVDVITKEVEIIEITGNLPQPLEISRARHPNH